MLKNIYIQIGHPGANYILRRFCTQFKDVLRENNIYHIEITDFYPDISNNIYNPYLHSDFWLITDNRLKKFNFPSQSVLEKDVESYIVSNNVESLFIIINGERYSETETLLTAFLNKFPNARVIIQENTLSIQKNTESFYCILKLNNHKSMLPSYFGALECYQNLRGVKPLFITSQPSIRYDYFSQHIFDNENDILKNWLSIFKIPYAEKFKAIGQAIFSLETISFIDAINEATETPIDWSKEYALLNYNLSEDYTHSYLPTYHKQSIAKRYKQAISTQKEINHAHKSLSLNRETAKKLIPLLSTTIKEKILSILDFSHFKYYSFNTKIAFATLLLVENKINEEQAELLLQKPQGRIFVGNKFKNSKSVVITIATASYNQKKYIKQCIESVLAQKTAYPYKHLIVDDGSTDGTQEILIEYAQKYPHIELILRKENNYSKARFQLFNSCNSKYVCLCDGDDYFCADDKLEKQANLLHNNDKISLCFHNSYVFYEQNKTVSEFPQFGTELTNKAIYTTSDIILTNIMQSSSVMYKWKLPHGIEPWFPYLVGPGDWAWNIIHSLNGQIGHIDEFMSVYRRHSKAIYYETEVNVHKHLVKNSFRELRFIQILNLISNYEHNNLFNHKQNQVLYNFYVTAQNIDFDKEEYNTIKQRLEKEFPSETWAFKELLKTNGIDIE